MKILGIFLGGILLAGILIGIFGIQGDTQMITTLIISLVIANAIEKNRK